MKNITEIITFKIKGVRNAQGSSVPSDSGKTGRIVFYIANIYKISLKIT